MLDGRRISRYDLAIDDFEMGLYNKQALRKIWKQAEACLNPNPIKIYRNGSRWSVDLYGTIKLSVPIVFGTGGNMNDSKDISQLFYKPENYNIIPINNIWDANTTRSRINQNNNP